MASETVIQQGSFTSTGVAVNLALRNGVDWIETFNYTIANAAAANRGVRYYWQLNMAAGNAIIERYNGAANAVNYTTAAADAVDGFTLIDTSINNPGNSVMITAVTAANPAVVTAASVTGLSNGDVVRLINPNNQAQYGGIDYTIGALNTGAGTFSLAYLNSTNSVASTAGFYRRIPYNPMFYPANRFITAMASVAGGLTRITLSVTNNYVVGQLVRVHVPVYPVAACGMPEIDGLYGSVVATGNADASGYTNTIDVDIDSSSFTAFALPIVATNVPFTQPQVVPFGEAATTSFINGVTFDPNSLSDAIRNQSFIGVKLGATQTTSFGPAGAAGNVIFWRAGTSFKNYTAIPDPSSFY